MSGSKNYCACTKDFAGEFCQFAQLQFQSVSSQLTQINKVLMQTVLSTPIIQQDFLSNTIKTLLQTVTALNSGSLFDVLDILTNVSSAIVTLPNYQMVIQITSKLNNALDNMPDVLPDRRAYVQRQIFALLKTVLIQVSAAQLSSTSLPTLVLQEQGLNIISHYVDVSEFKPFSANLSSLSFTYEPDMFGAETGGASIVAMQYPSENLKYVTDHQFLTSPTYEITAVSLQSQSEIKV